MQRRSKIVITDESGSSRTEELMTLQNQGKPGNDIGLSVSESKRLLNTVQQSWWSSFYRQTNILNTISGALTALLHAESKANRTYSTGRRLCVIPASGLRGKPGAAGRPVQRPSVCSSDRAGDHSHPALKYIETRWVSMIR